MPNESIAYKCKLLSPEIGDYTGEVETLEGYRILLTNGSLRVTHQEVQVEIALPDGLSRFQILKITETFRSNSKTQIFPPDSPS